MRAKQLIFALLSFEARRHPLPFFIGLLFRYPQGSAPFIAWNLIFKQRRFIIHSAFSLTKRMV
jgi:hypothetical protein